MIPEASIQQAFGVLPQANDSGALTGDAAAMAAFWEQQSVMVSTSPTIVDSTKSTGAPSTVKWLDQGFTIEIEARDSDCYVRARPDNGPASTTPLNGRHLPKGVPQVFWVPGQMFRYLDFVAAMPGGNVVFRRLSMARIRG